MTKGRAAYLLVARHLATMPRIAKYLAWIVKNAFQLLFLTYVMVIRKIIRLMLHMYLNKALNQVLFIKLE